MDVITNASKSELLLGASLVLLVISAYKYYYNVCTYWERKGLRGPRTLPFLGNLHKLILCDRPKVEEEWRQKYGKLYGIFMTSGPRLVVADPEVLRQICIQDFDSFQNHHLNELMNKFSNSSLFFLQNDHWKRVRALLSPTFTSGKIKRMFLLLDRCADDLVDLFGEKLTSTRGSTGVVNIKKMYNMFTMDAITTCCYGLKLERSGSTNPKKATARDEFIKLAMGFFEYRPLRTLAAVLIPRPILKSFDFNVNPESATLPLVRIIEQLINNRKTSNQTFNDYLQLLIDAKLEDKLELNDIDSQENHHASLTNDSLQVDQLRMAQEARAKLGGLDEQSNGQTKEILSALEIVSNAVFLLFVGLETTSTLLSNCSYALAFHQDIQERLYEELKRIAEYNETKTTLTFDYEKLTSSRYLDSVISETLRLLTPVLQIDRECNSDYYIEKYKLHLKKGSLLAFSFHAIHTDPDYWKEPRKFDPERFMPGNREKIVPGSYSPFGIGPRHCLGMRFSLTEAKLSLAKIMMKYRFEPAPNTQFPPPCKTTMALFTMKDPNVRIVPRT